MELALVTEALRAELTRFFPIQCEHVVSDHETRLACLRVARCMCGN